MRWTNWSWFGALALGSVVTLSGAMFAQDEAPAKGPPRPERREAEPPRRSEGDGRREEGPQDRRPPPPPPPRVEAESRDGQPRRDEYRDEQAPRDGYQPRREGEDVFAPGFGGDRGPDFRRDQGGPNGPRPDGPRGRGPMGMPPDEMDRMRRQDPEMFKLLERDQALERECQSLSEGIRRERDNKEGTKESREKLAALVKEHFEVRQKQRQLRLTRLEEELKRVRDAVETRQSQAEQIIKRRLNELTGEAEDIGF